MTQIHNFSQNLAWSEAVGHEPFWNAVYQKAFPNMVNHMMCSGDTQSQRMGVDRLIYLANGLSVSIDEKKRKKDYGDMLLEYISVDTTGAPGWATKDLAIDYLAYAIIPSKKCYLFPFQMLRRAWNAHGEEWKRKAKRGDCGYKIIPSRNDSYTTWSVAVPMLEFRRAISRVAIIDVSVELSGWDPQHASA